MLPEHAESIDKAVAEFQAGEFPTPYRSNQFFQHWGIGANRDRPEKPWESFEYYKSLLDSLHRADPVKLGAMHRGTPFFFLAFTSFDMGAYDRALFYLDAALAEDRLNSPKGWEKLPAGKLMRLRHKEGTTADRVVPELRNRLDEQLQRFRGVTRPRARPLASVDDFVTHFVEALLGTDRPESRHLVVGLYAWLFEYDDLFLGLVLRGQTQTSVLPVLSHLFRGGLLFESLLRLHYVDKELADIFKSSAFIKDFGNIKVRAANTWEAVARGMPNHSPEGAFSVTAKLRNFLGHNLVRRDVFAQPDRYRHYFEHEVDALFHVIAQKY